MAIYHLSIKIFSRGKGASAVAKAAYRAAECITNDNDGTVHDYIRKRGVVHKEIMLPDYAPVEYVDRAVLWNAVEKAETPKNAQLAREMELALPVELTKEQNISLVRRYVKQNFVDEGMCADVCVHDKNDGNPHAHIMLTMRPFNEDGAWGAKSRKEYILDQHSERIKLKNGEFKTRKICSVDWNELTKAEEWRSAWADAVNNALEQDRSAVKVDHRSYKRQGIPKIPIVHMGVAASQMERRSVRTERGDKNREISVTNKQLGQLRARIRKVKDWIYAQPLQDAPTMVDMMNAINGEQTLKSNWKRIANLQTAAKVLVFLQENGITNMAELADKVTEIHQSQYDLAGKIKTAEQRISTLNQHLAQVDIRKQHKTIYDKYKALDPKKRGAYKEKHADEIEAFESALRYLKENLNGRDKIPEKDWRAERDKLLAERYAHVDEYYKLADDVKAVEALRRGAERVMQEVAEERGYEKKRNIIR